MDRWLRATINSWHGLRAAARSEAAIREELIAIVIAVPLAFVIAEEAWKRLTLIAVIVFLLIVELLNTAVEKLSDRLTRAVDPEIGRVKDMGSAAVGFALLLVLAVWLLALAERLGWL
jgi:diacylglycerol kinase (ATP)